MSHPAHTRPLIYDDLVATTLPRPCPPSQPPPEPQQSNTPMFDSLNAEWISRRTTLATASLGTAAGAPCDRS